LKPNECRKFRKFDERYRGKIRYFQPDERKKLVRDKGGNLDIKIKLRYMQKNIKRPEVFETKQMNAGNW
jgi:hypothetical protein